MWRGGVYCIGKCGSIPLEGNNTLSGRSQTVVVGEVPQGGRARDRIPEKKKDGKVARLLRTVNESERLADRDRLLRW